GRLLATTVILSGPSSAAATGSLPQFIRRSPRVLVSAARNWGVGPVQGRFPNGFLSDRCSMVAMSRGHMADALVPPTLVQRPAGTGLAQPWEKERKREEMVFASDLYSSHRPTERSKNAIAESRCFCRWARPQHARLSGPCRASEWRLYRPGAS